MANVLVNNQSLTDIADAIRGKLNVQTTYKPGQMAAAISSIPTGSGRCPRAEVETVYDNAVGALSWDNTVINDSGGTRLTAYQTDVTGGYVANGDWYYSPSDTNGRSDIYAVTAEKLYLIRLGASVGNRFRVMFTPLDVTQVEENVTGVNIANQDNPTAYAGTAFVAPQNGYIVIGKTYQGVTGIETFVFEEE